MEYTNFLVEIVGICNYSIIMNFLIHLNSNKSIILLGGYKRAKSVIKIGIITSVSW